MRCQVLAIGIVFVMMTGVGEGASAQQIGPGDNVSAAYIKALSVANRFLKDWVTGNVGDAPELLSRRLREEIKEDPSWFAQYMSGLSNPHHLAFEIIGVQTEKADRYSFHVILYELAMAAPSGDSYGSLFDLVRQGDEWKVDELPKGFELPAPRPFESKH
jgi:hypothetical protein